MPQIVEVTTYSFDELSEEAKEEALERYYDWNVRDNWWYECTLEDWKEKLTEFGFSDIDISFSGFWNQGDGAAFIARGNVYEWMRKLKLGNKYRKVLNNADDFYLRIDKGRAYSNYQYGVPSIDGYGPNDETDKQASELEKVFTEWYEDTCHELYNSLRDEYEYHTSAENVIEALEVCGCQFLEDGTMYT